MKGPLERMSRTRGDQRFEPAARSRRGRTGHAGAVGGRAGRKRRHRVQGLAASWQGTEDSWRQHRPLPASPPLCSCPTAPPGRASAARRACRRSYRGDRYDTPFLIASVTSTFVASTVLEPCARGRAVAARHALEVAARLRSSRARHGAHAAGPAQRHRRHLRQPRLQPPRAQAPRIGRCGPSTRSCPWSEHPTSRPARPRCSNTNYILLGRIDRDGDRQQRRPRNP